MSTARLALDRIWPIATSGLMTERELMTLYECSRRAEGPGVLVEVGSWAGTSALTILAGQHDAGRRDARLYCIDTFEKGTKEQFDRNLGGAIASGEVIPLVGRSVDFAARWPADRPIKLLFLDGDHSYGAVRRELDRFTPHLVPGAAVLLHDCFYRPEPCRAFQVYFANRGVARAARSRLLRDRRFGWFEHEYSLLSARYHPDPAALGYPEAERARFAAHFEAHTALHSPALKAAYATYLVARAAKEAADRARLAGAARRTLATLGIRRLFGRPVLPGPPARDPLR